MYGWTTFRFGCCRQKQRWQETEELISQLINKQMDWVVSVMLGFCIDVVLSKQKQNKKLQSCVEWNKHYHLTNCVAFTLSHLSCSFFPTSLLKVFLLSVIDPHNSPWAEVALLLWLICTGLTQHRWVQCCHWLNSWLVCSCGDRQHGNNGVNGAWFELSWVWLVLPLLRQYKPYV